VYSGDQYPHHLQVLRAIQLHPAAGAHILLLRITDHQDHQVVQYQEAIHQDHLRVAVLTAAAVHRVQVLHQGLHHPDLQGAGDKSE